MISRQDSASFSRVSQLGPIQSKVTESTNFTPARTFKTPQNFEAGRKTMFNLKSPKANFDQLKKSAVFGGENEPLLPKVSQLGVMESNDLPDDEVQYQDVKTVQDQHTFPDLNRRNEDEDVKIYRVEIATNENFWNQFSG